MGAIGTSGQLALDGIEEAPALTDSLFFALLPDAAALERIPPLAQRLGGENGLTGRPFAAERLHITLYFLGEFPGLPPGIVARAGEAAASISAPPFEVVLDRVKSFAGAKRPLVLCNEALQLSLMAFQSTLAAAMIRAGLNRSKQPAFSPHMTLLYDSRKLPEQPIEPIVWTAREFVLVRSHLGQSRHETLARWSLTG